MPVFGGDDGGSAVERLAQRVDDAADDGVAYRDFQQAAGGFDGFAFLDGEVVAEDDGADGIFLEVEHLSHGAVLEFQELAGHGIAQAVDSGDAVADFDDGSDFVDLQSLLEAGDFALEDAGDFRDVDCHGLLFGEGLFFRDESFTNES